MNGKRRRTRKRWRTGLLVLLPCLAVVFAAIWSVPSIAPGRPGSNERPISESADRSGVPDRSRRLGVVSTDVLHVRSEASVDSPVLASYPDGHRVTILGEPVNGFLPVAHEAGEGWMAAEYLTIGDETAAAQRRPESVVDGAAAAESPHRKSAAVEPPIASAPDEPASDTTTAGDRWIEVDRSTATVLLREGNTIVATFQAKVGRDPSPDGYYATALGTFHVYSMSKELAETPFAEDVYLTDWVGFDPERNNGFHSPIRDASGVEQAVQSPTTMGCVRLDAGAAEAVFAFSYVGMRVEIHD